MTNILRKYMLNNVTHSWLDIIDSYIAYDRGSQPVGGRGELAGGS